MAVLPVVNMSPVLGLVRKGRKSSTWPLMCSAVWDRSLFTLMVKPAWDKTQHNMFLLCKSCGKSQFSPAAILHCPDLLFTLLIKYSKRSYRDNTYLWSLCQLIFNSSVHAVAIGGDLLDLELLLGEFLSQLDALLVPHTLQVLHLGLCYPALPLLVLCSLLLLERIISIKCITS